MNNTTCKNCGGDEAIHHYQTDQCPVGGREAPLGRKQEWKSTTFEPVEDALIKMQKRAQAAEARAAQLQVERDHYHALINSWIEHSAQMQAERDALAAELETVKAERDATQKCTLEKHYDKLGYPYIDGSCGVRYMPDEIDYREFVYCPFCGNENAAAK